ncbi:hypothetical protein [Halobacteriovorax sp. JY17]|uniref:hypothetical protein n=1 Tax=Halobacteriovorax sp. JY17 TaxID=2014617 RepID=UPI000C583656|nr:hypothetical protein [Halobacteriovorax sp. JY17]PIK15268.1 MAG: hypothetical protein CES88_00735 [Halobacteriovorax sp. JY17]
MRKMALAVIALNLLLVSCKKETFPAAAPVVNGTEHVDTSDSNDGVADSDNSPVEVDNRHEITKLIEETDLDSNKFSVVRKLYEKEVSKVTLSEGSDTAEVLGHIRDLSNIVKMVKGKNHFAVMCELYSISGCDGVSSAADLASKLRGKYLETDSLKGIIYDLVAFELVSEEEKEKFLNSRMTLNLLSNRLNSFSIRGGMSYELISTGLNLYKSIFEKLSDNSLYKVLNKFVRSYKIESIVSVQGVEKHFERYISIIIEMIDEDRLVFELNRNELSLIKVFLKNGQEISLKNKISNLFFISYGFIDSEVDTEEFLKFLDLLIYEEMKSSKDNLLSDFLNIPFLSSQLEVDEVSKVIEEKLKSALTDRSVEYRLHLLEVQKLKFRLRTDSSTEANKEIKKSITSALNSYYDKNYKSDNVFNLDSSSDNLFGNEVDVEDETVIVKFRELNIIAPGVYGIKNKHLDITFEEGVLGHPLSLIVTNGKNIKVDSVNIIGLNIYTVPTQKNTKTLDAESILREKYFPSLPEQFEEELVMDRSYQDQSHSFNRACSTFGAQIMGQVTKVTEVGIRNEGLIGYVSSPLLNLNGRNGLNAGSVTINAPSIKKITLIANGERGENGQSNSSLFFDNGVMRKTFERKFKLECETIDMFCYDRREGNCTSRTSTVIDNGSVVVTLKQPSPGLAGRGGDGGNITIKGRLKDSLISNVGGKSGVSGANYTEDVFYNSYLSSTNPNLYSPTYNSNLLESKLHDGQAGSLLVHE